MRVDRADTYTEDDNVIVHYEGEPYTGEVVSHDKGGRLIQLQTYVDGVSSGRSWHRNGQLARQTFYSDRGIGVCGRKWDKRGNLLQAYGTFPEDTNTPTPPGK